MAKALLDESGSALIKQSITEAEALTSVVIAYAELRAVLAAALRDGRVKRSERDDRLRALEALWAEVSELPVDLTLVRDAGDLAGLYGLRGYDAVHLAALRVSGPAGVVTFACWNRNLRAAAGQLGYELLPVQL